MQSVEPQVADLANSWMRGYGLDYKLEQENINSEIDKALEDYFTKNGGSGKNRPDAKLLLRTSQDRWYPIIIEYKGYQDKLVKLDEHGVVENKNLKNEALFKNINSYAVNGAVHYANAIIHHTSFSDIIAIGMTGWKDEACTLRHKIGVYFVSKSNFGVGQQIGEFSDLSFLSPEHFDDFIEQTENLILPQEEKDRIKEQREREISVSLMKLNNDIYTNEKNLGADERVYLVAASIIATIGIPKHVPSLKKEDLISSSEFGNTDGDIILRKIKAFLEFKNLPKDKKDFIIRTLQNTLTNENINRVENGETQLKRVFIKIVDNLGIYYKIGLTTDFTGKLYNEMYNWMNFSQDKLNDVVLTPSYVATLLAKLARVNQDSYVWDFATGSAGLLVAAMNEMLADAKNKSTSPEQLAMKEQHIKADQLLGIEVLPGIYMLAILNMILMGDGSSNILNTDSLNNFDGKYGFGHDYKPFPADAFVLNPPYSAEGNGMIFVEKALNMMNHGYAAIIIQGSAGSGKAKDFNVRILKNHTLLASIKMPIDLFIGKSSVQTYIYVFRVNEPHNINDIVKFIDFSKDGYTRSNRKKASCNLKDVDNAKERYDEIVNLVRFGAASLNQFTSNEYYEGYIDPNNGCDWNQTAPIDITPTMKDLQIVINEYLSWQITLALKIQSKHISKIGYEELSLTREEEMALNKFDKGETKFKIKNIWNEVFEVKNSHNILKTEIVLGSGDIPYVTAGEGNNSILGYINYDEDLIEKGNAIMIGGKTMVVTYQPENFFSNDSHNLILTLKNSAYARESSYLYFVAALKKALSHKYHWGDSISKHKIQSEKIAVPVSANEDIDFKYISNLIHALKKKAIFRLVRLLRSSDEHDNSDSTDGLTKNYFNVANPPSFAAEPFEIYRWLDICEEKDYETVDKDSILIGCYRDKKHLEWIQSHNLYNVRLGKRKGASDKNIKCFGNARILYLYDANDTSKTMVYNIIGNQEMSGAELKEMDYPRKSPGKSYMTFKIEEMSIPTKQEGITLDIPHVLSRLGNHRKGTPVFIESYKP